MMRSEIYLTIIIMALGGLWFVWDLGLKKLFLDYFRERLFQIRFRLFEMAEAEELSFDNDAYRAIETLLCGLLRYGHRVTFMSFILSVREQNAFRKSEEYVDYSSQIELKISRTPEAVQTKLREILSDTHRAVLIYISISSLLFMVGALVLMTLKALKFTLPVSKREISYVVESEAYRAEYRRSPAQMAAA
jgi:hypothetical protein